MLKGKKRKMKTKIVEMKDMILLPPAPHLCQKCAVEHESYEPHDQQSMFWHVWFKKEFGRYPTWKDAMEHCSEEMKKIWIEALKKYGVEI
jgi:hypothetical protein